jgi:sphingolipid delta-4 desaturase
MTDALKVKLNITSDDFHLDPLSAAPRLPVKDCSAHSRALQRSGPPATDFTWSDKGEIHAIRRREILAQHPEIKELYAPDIWSAVFAALTIALQLYMAWLVKDRSYTVIVPLAYALGGTCNHSLVLAEHELSHDNFFRTKLANRIMSYMCNLPIALPMAPTFRRYHLEHHSLGMVGLDMDVPSKLEGRVLASRFGRLIFLLLQPFFYALRPVVMNPKPLNRYELQCWAVMVVGNLAVQFLSDFLRSFLTRSCFGCWAGGHWPI